MKKKFSVKGTQREVSGEIKISKNYKTTSRRVYIPIWHDTKEHRIKVSKIEVFVEGKRYHIKDDICNESSIEIYLIECEKILEQRLVELANQKHKQKLDDRLKDKGYI